MKACRSCACPLGIRTCGALSVLHGDHVPRSTRVGFFFIPRREYAPLCTCAASYHTGTKVLASWTALSKHFPTIPDLGLVWHHAIGISPCCKG